MAIYTRKEAYILAKATEIVSRFENENTRKSEATPEYMVDLNEAIEALEALMAVYEAVAKRL